MIHSRADSVRNWMQGGRAQRPHAGIVLLAWVLAHQRPLTLSEQRLLYEIVQRWAMKGPFMVSIEASLRQNDDERLQACRLVATHYRGDIAVALLTAAIDVATADKRLSTERNHALRFIADMLSISADALVTLFCQRTGHRLPAPSDCSRAAFWRHKQRSDSARRSSQRKRPNCGPAERAADTLGVAVDADLDTLTRAFRRKAQQCHPDRVATADHATRDEAARRFRQVCAAYDYLRNRA